jgi:cytochrome c oxidase subunit 1
VAHSLHHGRRDDHAYLGGLHYWWPKISGRTYNELLAKVSAAIIFFGFNLTFFPQFVVGYLGMPRRYHAYPPGSAAERALVGGASILGVGYLLPMIYLAWSLRYGRIVGSNPGERSASTTRRRRRPRTSPKRRSSPGTYEYPTEVQGHVA